MASIFPTNPTDNQTYTTASGVLYIYKNALTAWKIAYSPVSSSSGSVSVTSITDATAAGKNILLAADSNAQMQLIIQSLPTTLPAQPGVAWNDGGYVAIS